MTCWKKKQQLNSLVHYMIQQVKEEQPFTLTYCNHNDYEVMIYLVLIVVTIVTLRGIKTTKFIPTVVGNGHQAQ